MTSFLMDSGKFSAQHIRMNHQNIIDRFNSYYESKGFVKHAPVSINSKMDPSVYLIGSTISVLKPYLFAGEIPDRGFYLVQRCIRTHNSRILMKDGEFPKWASYFQSIGTLSPVNRLNDVCREVWEFLHNELEIASQDIMIRASAVDEDLLHFWRQLEDRPVIELDAFPRTYYRHRYGHEQWTGRNINFALRQQDGDRFEDIGNLIVIEHIQGHEAGGVETAFGISTLLARKFSLRHPIEASLISTIIPFHLENTCKLSDALAVVLHLVREGIKPNASNTRGRILRAYLRGLSYLMKQNHYSPACIKKFAQAYELEEYGSLTESGEHLFFYLVKGEQA
ncbi:hypothetical protein [Paenibacillus medicaginis]|uniref:Alanine--tRNA ligase n=1 Tax=Paenibacillus medicaginis TaxID=1470560 RepID=A0ABV5BW04_9BACL